MHNFFEKRGAKGCTRLYDFRNLCLHKKASHLASDADQTNRDLLVFSFSLTWKGIFHYHAGVHHLLRTPSVTGSDFQYRLFLFFLPKRWVVCTS